MSQIFDPFDDIEDFNDDLLDDDFNNDPFDDEEDLDDKIIISDEDNHNITFTEYDDGWKTFELERPQAELNIFDTQYYLNNNPDVAEDVDERYEDTDVSVELDQTALSNPSNTKSLTDYSGAINHYVVYGASEGRDPSHLFDLDYYLDRNPDVASALAGGNFNGDPLLHYVEAGASEGRDPNPYFDTDYYLAQNPEVAATGLNPLEHYVLFGSSSGVDPSPNFDSSYYLEQNPDVLAAEVDPLAHYLTFGRDEGRLPIAE